jgi:hypothetical protein
VYVFADSECKMTRSRERNIVVRNVKQFQAMCVHIDKTGESVSVCARACTHAKELSSAVIISGCSDMPE